MKKRTLISTLLLLVIVSLKVSAFRMEPMDVDFTPDGEGSSKIFRIENEGDEKVAVKIHAYTRQIDDKGKETRVVSKDFKIYPEQITLAASDSRAVRVIYIGPKGLEQESAYRIVATQLPVEFKKDTKKTGVSFLYEFVASVYVTNEKFVPKIEVESITRIDKDNLKIKVINKGQKHTLLRNVKIALKDTSGKILPLDSKLIKEWDNENLLSGTRRTFNVKSTLNFDINANPPKIEIVDELK